MDGEIPAEPGAVGDLDAAGAARSGTGVLLPEWHELLPAKWACARLVPESLRREVWVEHGCGGTGRRHPAW